MQAVVRVLVGLMAACLTAALVKILHVITPIELGSLQGPQLLARLARLAELVGLTALHQALFIVPLALIAAMVTEINRVRGPVLYALIGMSIVGAGFYLQHAGESAVRTIVNPYAAQAYAIEGFVAGLVYWALSGRFAGWRRGGGVVKAKPFPIGAPQRPISEVTGIEGQQVNRALKS